MPVTPVGRSSGIDINSDLQGAQILVLVIPEDQYNDKVMAILKNLAESNTNKVCYVSLNRPYSSLRNNLASAGVSINSIYVIDAITKTAEMAENTENVEFISSPDALTELSLAVSNSFDVKKFNYLFFDSLSTLLVYESDRVVTKFVHFLMAKIRVVEARAIFTVLKRDVDSVLLKDINMFADKIVDLEYWNPK
ncbi:Uncharacterised protein [uncultured archaeon]|nr:Uncharacterised protein [uncultured archaeon]